MTDPAQVWGHVPQITDDQAQHMRLVIAGRAIDVDDAALLLKAFGLIPDAMCDRWEISTSRKHKIKKVP